MERLPLELIQRTFTFLDLVSLRNVALSCRTCLDAFKNAEVLITSEILLRQIDPSVLPEAILVYKSWRLGKPSIDTGTDFANVHLRSWTPAPSKWRLVDALPLERFHRFVDYFATQFANEALEKQPRLVIEEQPKPSCEEIHRFQRAFYRLQLYCNVVGHVFPVTDDELREMFFGHYAAWENEQLACIHDYLVRVVAKPFNYMVDHDVTWGFLRIPYINRHNSSYGQYRILEGLEIMYYLSKASTYEQWHALLSRGEDQFSEPFYTDVFLHRGLEQAANVYPMYINPLSELDDDDRDAVVGWPFYDDPDRGPALMWEWVHKDEIPGSLVADPLRRHHRQWAYTFWNLSRLETAGLLRDPSISEPGPRSELELEEYRTEERLKNLKESQQRRATVWSSGGSGFWRDMDQSKVIWPRPAHGRLTTPPLKPQSLAEAKRFLQDLSKGKNWLYEKGFGYMYKSVDHALE